MLAKILSLTQKLISIRSTSGNKKELDQALEIALTPLKKFKIERFEKNGIKSALIYNTSNRTKKFKVLLNGHLDVIPGKESQYLPRIKKNKLYGAGSMDMKSGVACLILIFQKLANKVNYPLGLQLVTDEEVGGFNGTKHQIDKGVRTDFVIVGESTNLKIENQTKGILWAKIAVKGRAGHGAYPWKGENAIWKMKKFLNLLEKKYPICKPKKYLTTVNLSKVETNNQTFNKIPDDCQVWLDIRFLPEESKKIVRKVKKLMPKGFKLDIILKEPAHSTYKNNLYVKLLQKAGKSIIKKKLALVSACGSSDVRHFSLVNCAGVEFGPKGRGMGSDKEWVDIKSLEKYYLILEEFLSSL